MSLFPVLVKVSVGRSLYSSVQLTLFRLISSCYLYYLYRLWTALIRFANHGSLQLREVRLALEWLSCGSWKWPEYR